MTTAVANTAAPAAPIEAAPFPALPGNEGLDGTVAADPVTTAAEEVTEDQNPAAEAGEELNPDGTPKVVAAPAKLYFEKYKSPEELEAAHKDLNVRYEHSSSEGKRLNARVKEIETAAQSQAVALRDQIAELTMQAQLGPEIPEPSEAELEAMGPVKAMRTLQKIESRKNLAAQLKQKLEDRKASDAQYDKDLKAHTDTQISEMLGDAAKYPDYRELREPILALADKLPWATGNPNSARALYLMAFGERALANLAGAKAKTLDSAKKAKDTAAAAAAATAAPGAGGGATDPTAAKKTVNPDSDEAVNLRMQQVHARKHRDPFAG